MGKFKEFLLKLEQESERRAANSDPGDVSDPGGDAMDSAAQDWIAMKNEFGKQEAEQERKAYEAEMRRDEQEAALDREPDSRRDECPPESNDGQSAEPAPESGPKPVMVTQMAQLPTPPANQIQGGVLYKKQRHGQLILEGVCTHCAHCALKLTDAESVERGLGPICSKKGYFEEPKDGDEMQAFIDLAEYPELVEFLTKHYKPQGVRGLVNGLVRVCSLNRKSEVHKACTDAIESLGYKSLASLLRESLCVVEIKESEKHPGSVEIWCKKADWKYSFTNALRALQGAFFSKALRATVVPMHRFVTVDVGSEVQNKTEAFIGWDPTTGKKDTHKRIVWNLLMRHYKDFFVKTPKGCYRINEKSLGKAK